MLLEGVAAHPPFGVLWLFPSLGFCLLLVVLACWRVVSENRDRNLFMAYNSSTFLVFLISYRDTA